MKIKPETRDEKVQRVARSIQGYDGKVDINRLSDLLVSMDKYNSLPTE